MEDTRTIYLHTPEETFSSDPSDNGYQYLDLSDFDNLNPTRGTVVAGKGGTVATYEPYEVELTVTFTSREQRAQWIQKNADRVYQISVANTPNHMRVYNKKCAITGFEFLENPYINGVQTKIHLKMFGRWQSSLTKLDINAGEYSGGTKEFTQGGQSPYYYVYDNALAYGLTAYTSEIELDGEQGFVLVSPPNTGLTFTLSSEYNNAILQLESKHPDLITGLSTDFVAYPYTSFVDLSKFSMLDGGTAISYGYIIENTEYPLLYDMINYVDSFPISVGAVNQAGNAASVTVYAYTSQDFI